MFDDMYPKRETGFEHDLRLEAPELDFDFFEDDFCGPVIIEPATPIQEGDSDKLEQLTLDLSIEIEERNQDHTEKKTKAEPVELFPLNEYDTVILHLSGGADSMGCLFWLKKEGLDFSKLEIWHQAVDGKGEDYNEFWDWPVTEAYCEAVAEAFGVPIYYQWREGGLYGELMRENRLAGDVLYMDKGNIVRLETKKGKHSTRKRFPAQSADLMRRWCSASGKSDPARRTLNNNPRYVGSTFKPKKILFITGERRSEGGNRSNYLKAEKHSSTTRKRIVHHWRPVIDETKASMFELHREFGIMPHPVYYLGFGRVSCMGCVFSTAHQWAALQHIAGERVERFAQTEQLIGHTVDVKLTVVEKAAKGAMEKVLPLNDPNLPRWIEMALSRSFTTEDLFTKEWIMPIGASRGCDGGAQ
ncbi:hypothetical protein [Paenibacillus prosopidis]|uniref:3'-phosphoadenosine 5'-phosphosulfate sulfotransferase (PAPS reductase)/FAD synthetase n=1 Tax=Paenibacillus prosopidis TaxID=630520 RepID=A0A368VJM1_9BACL|nr:hypothetical protein [Paenibacillus prosopidis]RCW41612.1 3'-phosphoadenosine 5'-phosphosulfate sulfotransferase (PAPS reductase)/FAD synthetase [Paenibacillus prosopidis]